MCKSGNSVFVGIVFQFKIVQLESAMTVKDLEIGINGTVKKTMHFCLVYTIYWKVYLRIAENFSPRLIFMAERKHLKTHTKRLIKDWRGPLFLNMITNQYQAWILCWQFTLSVTFLERHWVIPVGTQRKLSKTRSAEGSHSDKLVVVFFFYIQTPQQRCLF